MERLKGLILDFWSTKKVKSSAEKTNEIVDKHLDSLNLTNDDIVKRVASPLDTSAFVRRKRDLNEMSVIQEA
jgi:hypothetical protein